MYNVGHLVSSSNPMGSISWSSFHYSSYKHSKVSLYQNKLTINQIEVVTTHFQCHSLKINWVIYIEKPKGKKNPTIKITKNKR